MGTPIRIRIYSPSVVNLTVVDLPGIVKVSLWHTQIDAFLRVFLAIVIWAVW